MLETLHQLPANSATANIFGNHNLLNQRNPTVRIKRVMIKSQNITNDSTAIGCNRDESVWRLKQCGER